MPETFSPITWADGSGGATPITAAQLNRIEVGVESMDDRITEADNRLDSLDFISNIGNAGSSLTLTAGGSSGTVKLITLNAANCTLTFNAPTADGRLRSMEFVITQDATGGRTITWPASVKWAGGVPSLSTAAGAVDRVVVSTYNAGTTWYGDLVGKAYA